MCSRGRHPTGARGTRKAEREALPLVTGTSSSKNDCMQPGEPHASTSGSAPPPRRRVLRRVLIAGAVLLAAIAVGIAFLPAILSSDFAKRRVLAAARGRITGDIDARDLSFSWGGPQRIEGLRIGSPPGFPEGEDVLRIESLDLAGGLFGLALSEEPIVLEIVEPVLNVRRNAKGEVNLEALVPKPAGEPGRPRPPPE